MKRKSPLPPVGCDHPQRAEQTSHPLYIAPHRIIIFREENIIIIIIKISEIPFQLKDD